MVKGRIRGCAFRYKDLEEAKNSAVLTKPHRQVDFGTMVVTPRPVAAISVAGWCQGWRKRMEDTCRLACTAQGAFAVVLDGHRGEEAAQFCGDLLSSVILEYTAAVVEQETAAEATKARDTDNGLAVELPADDPHAVVRREMFLRAFMEVDAQLYDEQ
ncbi:hypothetical protein DQ04_10551040, partial [Trypanosoma grayi]|uniref:hypothetical protein n=1 Tax=Trypanosoma grayi TaxID=71804 RepID=UPI0004F421FC